MIEDKAGVLMLRNKAENITLLQRVTHEHVIKNIGHAKLISMYVVYQETILKDFLAILK